MIENVNNFNNHPNAPSFLVGVMHVTREPWLSIVRNGQLPAWEKTNYENFSVLYFFGTATKVYSFVDSIIESMRWTRGRYASYGISYFLMVALRAWLNWIPEYEFANESKSKVSAPALKVRIPELTSTMRWKKLAFLKYFLKETNAEYAIITTSSSLISFGPIVEFIAKSVDPNQPLYAGRICQAHDCDFTSGSFTILNRRSALLLLESKDLIPVHVMDDIGFGTAFKRLAVAPDTIRSQDLDSTSKLAEMTKDELLKIGHFRFKSGSSSSRGDIEIMNELLSRTQAN